MNELSLYKLVPVIRRCLGPPVTGWSDEEIRSYLNEAYEQSHDYGRIRELTLKRLRERQQLT